MAGRCSGRVESFLFSLPSEGSKFGAAAAAAAGSLGLFRLSGFELGKRVLVPVPCALLQIYMSQVFSCTWHLRIISILCH